MNTIERKKKEAERKRKARLLQSDEQKRISCEYRASLTSTPDQKKAGPARVSAYRERRSKEESDEQKRIRLQAKAERDREYRYVSYFIPI